MSFADIASELGGKTATPAGGFGAIANELGLPKKAKATVQSEPSFQTDNPAKMREALVKSGDPAVLAVFDRQFPDLAGGAGAGRGKTPASAYQQPLSGADAVPGGTVPGTPDAPESWWDKIKGMTEAAASTVAGIPAGIAGNVAGIVEGLKPSNYGTPEGARRASNKAADTAGAITNWVTNGKPTQAGERYAGKIADVANSSGLVAVAPLAEFQTLTQAAGPALRAGKDAARSTMDAARSSFAEKAMPPRIEPTLEKPLYRRVGGEWQQVTTEPTATPQPQVKGAITFDSPPVEGGVPKQVIPDRAAVLKRIGLEDVRSSAVTGDAAKAGQDFQVSRFTSEPAGLAAKAQFDAERQALVNHGEKTVQATGGTIGLDQDALNVRGQTLAKPFDGLRSWFESAKKELYAEADKRSGGLPSVKTDPIEGLLNDRSFNNSAMAQDKGNLVSAIKNQLELFKENNPQGLTVKNVEEFNQWLNQNWSPANAPIIAKVRAAADKAVTAAAGEDVYAKSRAIHQLEKKTLDNPNGVAKLMDFDPKTPINRVTPYDKIPDTLTRLSPAQFENVVKTLKEMPKELQPDAQAALAEIRAHYANKALDAGANNKGQWNAKKVSDFKKSNSANLQTAFKDSPESFQMLSDLESAGHILDYPSSYPGAAAQAAQVMKRGVMSGMVQKAGSFVGGGTGAVFGPGGAAVGAAAGDVVGGKLGASMGEKKALKKWQSGVTKLSDLPQ